MDVLLKFIAIVVAAYVLGSIPFGMLIGKIFGGVDITKHGSGKTGTTNVLRTVGKGPAVLAAMWDIGKGALAVALATWTIENTTVSVFGFTIYWQVAQVAASLAVMAGHNWSCFLKFRGGRGVAVFFGSMLAIWPPLALVGAAILLVVVLRTRYMSLGSILGACGIWTAIAIVTVFYNYSPVYLVYGLIATFLIIWQHRDNIQRLAAGTERCIGLTPNRDSH